MAPGRDGADGDCVLALTLAGGWESGAEVRVVLFILNGVGNEMLGAKL